MTIHGATRSTKDIDVLVSPEDLPQVLDVVRPLGPLGYAFAAPPMVFDEGTDRERHVQRVSKIVAGEHLVLDLLLATAAFAGFLQGRQEILLPTRAASSRRGQWRENLAVTSLMSSMPEGARHDHEVAWATARSLPVGWERARVGRYCLIARS